MSLEGRSQYWLDAGTGSHARPDGGRQRQRCPGPFARAGASHSIDGQALWIQFDVEGNGGQPWYLALKSSGIDRVQLFYRAPEGDWVAAGSRRHQAVSDWPLPGRFPTFELSPVIGKPVRYWLRIEHERVDFATPITIQDRSSLLAIARTRTVPAGRLFRPGGPDRLGGQRNAVVFRDRNFGVYAAMWHLAAGQVAYLGVGAQHVWDHWLKWNEVATFLLPGLSSAAALWFARTVTEPARFSKALDLLVWSLIAALLSAVALDTFIASRGSFALVMVLTAWRAGGGDRVDHPGVDPGRRPPYPVDRAGLPARARHGRVSRLPRA